ncbi:unnamed protein product, partial [Musa banksii]
MAKAEESTNKFATISHGGIEFMASTCQVSGPNQLIKVDADVFNSVHRLFFSLTCQNSGPKGTTPVIKIASCIHTPSSSSSSAMKNQV